MAVAWLGVFVVMGAPAGAGVSKAFVYGTYPATVPLMVAGLAWAGIMAARANWRACSSGLAVAAAWAFSSSSSAPPPSLPGGSAAAWSGHDHR